MMVRLRFRFVVSTLIALLLVQGVTCAQSASQKSKREKLEREIAILDRQLKETSNKSSNALSKLTLVRKKVGNSQKLLSQSEHEVALINDRMTAKQREINRLNERLDTLDLYYRRLVKNAYKNRDAKIWYMYILGSDNLAQGMRRFAYLKSLSDQMSEQVVKMQQTRSELQHDRAQLDSLRMEAVKIRDVRAGDLSRLRKDEKQNAELVSQLKREKSKYQKQLDSKRRQVEALNREIERLITSSTSKKSGQVPKPIDQKLSGAFEANKGKLPWPVDEGSVVDHYGQHYHPVYKSVKLPFNNGVGIAVPSGTKVKAVFDGEVRQIIVMPGYNQCVLVQHGAYFTFYCKLKSVAVKNGDKVKAGQVIGVVDTIAGETQVHFQLWKDRNPQDPENWLR